MKLLNDLVLLRAEYDSLAQLLDGLREAEGAPLLLFRSTALRSAPGLPVLLELSFRDAAQYRVVRGAVGARTSEGTWIVLRRRLVEDLRVRGLPTRRQRRLGCDEPVTLRVGGRSHVTRMLDMSASGARLGGAFGVQEGEQVHISHWAGGRAVDLGPAEVVWRAQGELGVRFARADDGVRASIRELFARLMQAWASAPEASVRRTTSAGSAA